MIIERDKCTDSKTMSVYGSGCRSLSIQLR